jgi:hypothetical protein
MDLKGYPDHNASVLSQLIDVVSFRRECESKMEAERWEQDDKV